ncbi:MAG: DNA-binding domain-containing protein, partial [Steroidobacter sp.]
PWLIWRQNFKTNYRSLSNAEAEVLDLLIGGGSFETMCDALCATCEADEVPLRAAALLKGWIADGLLVGVRS